jgi:hypothetical protein
LRSGSRIITAAVLNARVGRVGAPVVQRFLAQAAELLIDLVPVMAQRLDAVSAPLGVEVALAEDRTRRLDALLDTQKPRTALAAACCCGCGFPIPTTSTVFEVAVDGRILPVSGERLKKWIEKRRAEWTGPRGFLFSKRPMIGS